MNYKRAFLMLSGYIDGAVKYPDSSGVEGIQRYKNELEKQAEVYILRMAEGER